MTIPGGVRDPKGELNVSVTHFAPSSEDTLCSGPDTPSVLRKRCEKPVHSHRRFTEGCAPDESFRSHGLGKQLCKCAVSDADYLAGGLSALSSH